MLIPKIAVVPRTGSVPIPEEQLRPRYLRAVINRNSVGLSGSIPLASLREETRPAFEDMKFAVAMAATAKVSRLPAVGCCIYCGKTEYASGLRRPLGDEHIISEGMGGVLVLNEASCRECEGYTSAAESSVLGNAFVASRHQLGVGLRGAQKQRTKFHFTSVINGQDVRFDLPLDRHPTMIFLLALRAPGILINRPLGHSGVHGFWLYGLNDFDKSGVDSVVSPHMDTVRFAQFLAKTGHAFAIAMLGDAFTFHPLLPALILRKFKRADQYPECYNLVGGMGPAGPPSHAMHELGFMFSKVADQWFLLTAIRLFANLGAPTYLTVVGPLKDGITPEAVMARSRDVKSQFFNAADAH